MKARVWSGVDRIETVDAKLKGRRVGLMTNPTGITHDFQSTIDVLRSRYQLTALFAVEHGIRGDIQAGEKIETYVDAETGITVHSVYAGSHRLSAEMLDAFDVLVFDMQDVGARFYTYIYSLAYAMEECARAGKPVVVLDRMNPIGAARVEGTVLDNRFASFVGRYGLPTRYGLTVGEYALFAKDYLALDIDLTVVPLEGYRRAYYLDDTDTPWVAPSPNCATLHAALCYVGMCIFEGTNLSEGRGTTLPFELIGAPWIDSAALAQRMAKRALPGLHFRRTSFIPTFSKHEGALCHGVQVHITNRDEARMVEAGLLLLDTIRGLHPEAFEFRCWEGRYSIDLLLGTDALRVGGMSGEALLASQAAELAAFRERAKAYHLYT